MPVSKNNIIIYNSEAIQRKIYTIRNVQVILDSDLAAFYGVETRALNQAVKRNIERFPSEFMFRLKKEELENMRSQIVTTNDEILKSQFVISKGKRGGRQKMPYVFTEQGVAMLSAVLRSGTAVKRSIQIMNAFVSMRKFLINNASVFQKIDSLERNQVKFEIETNDKFENVFNALQSIGPEPAHCIFYDGQVFDAHRFVSGLIRNAGKSLLLIDNYVDENVLSLFTKRKQNVTLTILTKEISKSLALDIKRFNTQYQPVYVKVFKYSQDRSLIIDDRDVYHFGASLNDLGKKWFAFSKFDKSAFEILDKLKDRNILNKEFV